MKVGKGFYPLLALVCCLACYGEAKVFQGFFVPEDVQTILNLAYSRLPPVKLGSDKRYGVGFRLGRNADFQMVLELGPQSETVPLVEPSNSLSKRESRRKKYHPSEKPNTAASKTFSHKTGATKTPSNKTGYNKKEDTALNSVDGTELTTEDFPVVQKEFHKHTFNEQAVTKVPHSKIYSQEKGLPKKSELHIQKKQDSFYDIFIKWLTRLTPTSDKNVTKINS